MHRRHARHDSYQQGCVIMVAEVAFGKETGQRLLGAIGGGNAGAFPQFFERGGWFVTVETLERVVGCKGAASDI